MNKDNKQKYFTAGELAGIFNISKQSLLYYDKVHLLSPDYISENGYRHYSVQQFLDLEIIVNLRALDISIANIKEYLTNRSKEHFQEMLLEKTKECEEIIRKNQEICNTIERINSFIEKNNQNTCHEITLTWRNEHLLRVTTLNAGDDPKKRIAKFAKHTQKQAHNKATLPNHTGWTMNQETFFEKQDFFRSEAFFSCAKNSPDHKRAMKKILPAGLYLEIVFTGTFYKNGPLLVQRIQKFLQANELNAVGNIYILPLENHWFSEDCTKYLNKIFLRVQPQHPQE